MKPVNLLDDLEEINTTKEKLGKGYIVLLAFIGLLLLMAGSFFYYGVTSLDREAEIERDKMLYLVDSLIKITPDTTYIDTTR